MINENNRFQLAIQRFDSENSQDPNIETMKGTEFPKELLYAQRMTKWLNRINPGASEPLKLAARISDNDFCSGRPIDSESSVCKSGIE